MADIPTYFNELKESFEPCDVLGHGFVPRVLGSSNFYLVKFQFTTEQDFKNVKEAAQSYITALKGASDEVKQEMMAFLKSDDDSIPELLENHLNEVQQGLVNKYALEINRKVFEKITPEVFLGVMKKEFAGYLRLSANQLESRMKQCDAWVAPQFQVDDDMVKDLKEKLNAEGGNLESQWRDIINPIVRCRLLYDVGGSIAVHRMLHKEPQLLSGDKRKEVFDTLDTLRKRVLGTEVSSHYEPLTLAMFELRDVFDKQFIERLGVFEDSFKQDPMTPSSLRELRDDYIKGLQDAPEKVQNFLMSYMKDETQNMPESVLAVLSEQAETYKKKQPLKDNQSAEEFLPDSFLKHMKERLKQYVDYQNIELLSPLPAACFRATEPTDDVLKEMVQHSRTKGKKADWDNVANFVRNNLVYNEKEGGGIIAVHRVEAGDNNPFPDEQMRRVTDNIREFKDAFNAEVVRQERRGFMKKAVAVGVGGVVGAGLDEVVYDGETRQKILKKAGSVFDSDNEPLARVSPDDVERDGASLKPLNERE